MLQISVALFGKESGFSHALDYRNESEKYQVKVAAPQYAKLRELLALDFQLYQLALQIFDTRVSDAIRSMG
jgi:hypothetical protein